MLQLTGQTLAFYNGYVCLTQGEPILCYKIWHSWCEMYFNVLNCSGVERKCERLTERPLAIVWSNIVTLLTRSKNHDNNTHSHAHKTQVFVSENLTVTYCVLNFDPVVHILTLLSPCLHVEVFQPANGTQFNLLLCHFQSQILPTVSGN